MGFWTEEMLGCVEKVRKGIYCEVKEDGFANLKLNFLIRECWFGG